MKKITKKHYADILFWGGLLLYSLGNILGMCCMILWDSKVVSIITAFLVWVIYVLLYRESWEEKQYISAIASIALGLILTARTISIFVMV